MERYRVHFCSGIARYAQANPALSSERGAAGEFPSGKKKAARGENEAK